MLYALTCLVSQRRAKDLNRRRYKKPHGHGATVGAPVATLSDAVKSSLIDNSIDCCDLFGLNISEPA
jgi:hypothetical protein